jgi:glycosyltransferase involved in cell wall biosynthesis
MTGSPRISIIVPSFNQARFVAETLDSLLAQQWPDLEVLVQDGGSTDGTVDILMDYQARHPEVFRVVVERDAGQADALNRGFARATGEIQGFLNTDDTLLPGTLQRVAAEIDPALGRHVVVGRCLFVGDGGKHVGAEHPSFFEGSFDLLAIWRRGYNCLPQPSVFWHREVFARCGPFAPERHVLDYELFCRFSRRYWFHTVDEVWSTYRIHADAKTAQASEEEVLAMSISASRRNWGPWWSLLRWRLAASLWWHGYACGRPAALRLASEATREGTGRPGRAWRVALAALLAPRVAWDRFGRPAWALRWFIEDRPEPPFYGRYADGWIGPEYRAELDLPAGTTQVAFVFEHRPHATHRRVEVDVAVEGAPPAHHVQEAAGQFFVAVTLQPGAARRARAVVRCRGEFLPARTVGGVDHRRLCLQLLATDVR